MLNKQIFKLVSLRSSRYFRLPNELYHLTEENAEKRKRMGET